MNDFSDLYNQLFSTLFDKSRLNAILIMDREGTILSVNNAFTNSFGYTQEMIKGKNTSVLYTEQDKSKGLPEKELKKVMSTGQATDKNYLVHADGTVSWVSGESVFLQGSDSNIILKVIQDIQSEKQGEVEINNLSLLNEKILSSIEDVVIVLDKELNIIKYNEAFLRLFKKGNIGDNLNFNKLIEPYDKDNTLIKDVQGAFKMNEGFAKRELAIDSISGDKMYFNISCVNLSEQDSHLLLVVHNITAHKIAERQREDIISFVAHELRNPLANIILCNDLLGDLIKMQNINDSIELLSRSKSSVMRLNKLVSELYDATKISSGNLTLKRSLFRFNDMIEEAILAVQVLYPDSKIEANSEVAIEINADKYRLIQVVTNYLSNAIKYSVGKCEVKLFVEKVDKNIVVNVTDYGLGIDPKQMSQIFSRFFRADRTKNLEGAGLGLYLCKQIIEAHKGKVWVTSEEGRGSSFYFSLPIDAA